MTRTNIAVTIAFLAVAGLFGSPAEACISCNYTPEVVNTPVGKAPKGKKVAKPERTTPPAKKHIAKKPPPTAPTQTAKGNSAPKDVANDNAKSQEPAEAGVETAAAPSSGSATAALAAQGAREPKSEAPVGCKKFSATAGTTVEVPCE